MAYEITLALVEQFEGFRPEPYLCPAGVWTIGLGTTMYPDGRMVRRTDPPVTIWQAREYALCHIGKDAGKVLAVTPNLIVYTNIYGAILDFCYNLGAGAYRASTLAKKIKEEQWADARIELLRWVRGGGRVLPGLVKRRIAESAYFLT